MNTAQIAANLPPARRELHDAIGAYWLTGKQLSQSVVNAALSMMDQAGREGFGRMFPDELARWELETPGIQLEMF